MSCLGRFQAKEMGLPQAWAIYCDLWLPENLGRSVVHVSTLETEEH